MPERTQSATSEASASAPPAVATPYPPKAPVPLQAPASPPLTEEEALLAQRLRRHMAAHPRHCVVPSKPANERSGPITPGAEAGREPEEVCAIEDAAPGLPPSAPIPPPLPARLSAVAATDEAGAEDGSDDEAAGAQPVWEAIRDTPSLKARLAAALAWMTTLAVVATVTGSAALALIGTQRCTALAEGVIARIVEAGRAAGLVHG